MRILILGGSIFLGSATVDAARLAGHDVTVFNRGRARTAWPEGVEALYGDRSVDLAALRGRRWDAVIDSSGYVPAEIRTSTEALIGQCGRYLFVSSISAYASTSQVPVTEDDALACAVGIARDDRTPRFYGAQKAACERGVAQALGDRATIVRPGLIVGPGDPTGRFSYWPWRSGDGGEMLVPDMQDDDAVLQFIDVRDLAVWLVRLVHDDRGGVFNATGAVGVPNADAQADPAADAVPPTPHRWSTLLRVCAAEVSRRGGTPALAIPVAQEHLLARGVAPWSELPLWLPSTDRRFTGFFHVDTARAASAGLRTRPLQETVGAVLDEGRPASDDPRRAGRLGREAERTLLATWASSPAGEANGA